MHLRTSFACDTHIYLNRRAFSGCSILVARHGRPSLRPGHVDTLPDKIHVRHSRATEEHGPQQPGRSYDYDVQLFSAVELPVLVIGKTSLCHDILSSYLLRHHRAMFPAEFQAEYDRVRVDPGRKGAWDRVCTFLRPSHRVVMHTYRRFGLLLPFGAVYSHCNSPNVSLFSEEGEVADGQGHSASRVEVSLSSPSFSVFKPSLRIAEYEPVYPRSCKVGRNMEPSLKIYSGVSTSILLPNCELSPSASGPSKSHSRS